MTRFRRGMLVPVLAAAAACGAPGQADTRDAERTAAHSAAPVEAPAAIIDAVRAAYALDSLYLDSLLIPTGQRPPREVVLAHFRRGFTDSLATVYAEYRLSGSPEKSMEVPDSVVVLRVAGAEAMVAYRTPEVLREIWAYPAYTIDRLRRTGGRWQVASTERTDQRPAGF